MNIGIYRIVSPSNKVYIGQTWNFNKRKFEHFNPKNVLRNKQLVNSISKYGVNAHIIEIIHDLPIDTTQEVMDQYEILYWEMYKDVGFKMMNVRFPGSRGRHSEETKERMRDAKRNDPKAMEHASRLGSSKKGITFSEEHLAKMKANHKGNTGRSFSEEHKKRLGVAIKAAKAKNKAIRNGTT